MDLNKLIRCWDEEKKSKYNDFEDSFDEIRSLEIRISIMKERYEVQDFETDEDKQKFKKKIDKLINRLNNAKRTYF